METAFYRRTHTQMDNKRLRRIEVEYRNSWILAIILFFLSILFPIVTFIITCELKWNTSVFLAFPLVHLWWFALVRAFFIRKLIYHPSLIKRLFWLTFFWPFLIFILLLVDYASNLWVTKALFTSIFFLSGALSSIIASVATVLPLLARELSSRFLNKIDIEALGFTRERVIMSGFGERFYESPEVLRKGLPILIGNRTKRAVVVSHIMLGVTTLNVPLNFETKSGIGPIEYEEEWTLPEWVVVESRSSQILYIPWQKVMNASKRAEEMTQKVRKRPRFQVGIYDPFLNRKFWSKEINHQSLLQEFSYLEWVKKHPEWGRK